MHWFPQDIWGLLFHHMGPRSHTPWHLPRRAQDYLYERSSIKSPVNNNAQQLQTGIAFHHVASYSPTTGDAPFRSVDSNVPAGFHSVRVLRVDQRGVEERPGLERAWNDLAHRCRTGYERVYCFWAEHRQFHGKQEGGGVEYDCGRCVSQSSGLRGFGKLIKGLHSEYQAGVNHSIRCVHVQSPYYQHERRRDPVHAYRRSVVRICGLRREEEADFWLMNFPLRLPTSPCLPLSYLSPNRIHAHIHHSPLLSVGTPPRSPDIFMPTAFLPL